METTDNRKGIFTGIQRAFHLRRWFLVFILAMTPFLYAQDSERSRNEIVKTGEGFQIYQIISFPAVSNALSYEVEIEQLDGREPVTVEKIETRLNRVRVSLRVGNYRYRVTAYNKMGLLDGRSEWQNFRVIPVVEPSGESYQPFYGLFFDLKDPEGILFVTGNGFSPQTEFALIPNSNYNWSGIVLENRRDVIIPSQVEVDGNEARLSFARSTLKKGTYQIFMRNPGGLWTCFGKVVVGFHNKNDLTLSFGYSPMLATFDIENAITRDGAEKLDFFNPQGYNFRFSWLFVKGMAGRFGLELQLYYLVDKVLQREWDEGGRGSLLEAINVGTLNMLYQWSAAERWQHNIRFGIGLGEPYHYDPLALSVGEFGYMVNPYENLTSGWYLNLGYSAQFFLWKNLYLEAGLDIQYVVARGVSLNHLILRPTLGLGWQMGRWAEYSEVAERARRGEDYSVPVTEPPRAESFFSVAWLPMVPLFGFDLYAYGNGYDINTGNLSQDERYQFLKSFNAGGVGIRFGALPYRWGNNKLGFGMEFSLLEHSNRDLVSGKFLDLLNHALFGIYYQRVVAENWHIGGHAGIGLSNAYEYEARGSYASFNGGGVSPAMNFGASAQYFFGNAAYIEAGLDLVLLRSWGGGGTNKAALRPSLAFGWQGSRNNETGLRLPGTGFPLRRIREQVIE